MKTTFLAVALFGVAGLLSAGTPDVFSLTSIQCDPIVCYEGVGVDAFETNFVFTNVYGNCKSGAEPYAFGSVWDQNCLFDTYLYSAGGVSNNQALYLDDYYGYVRADQIGGAGLIYEDFLGFGEEVVYEMETASDCYDDSTSEDIPPMGPC
ncbi:MAG: hypothetical protein JO307_15570 [Bryobacterales bacterium]|nr:hypothetical protein [Bryobacterales bacterium]MBV9400304.1 hypothetical protein [Bryobacterales bacterium]